MIPYTCGLSVATAKDLNNMLDYASEDIDGMDDDAGEEQAQNRLSPDVGRPSVIKSETTPLYKTASSHNMVKSIRFE